MKNGKKIILALILALGSLATNTYCMDNNGSRKHNRDQEQDEGTRRAREESTPPMSLENLPLDLKYEILNHMSPEDAARMRCVNESWHNIIRTPSGPGNLSHLAFCKKYIEWKRHLLLYPRSDKKLDLSMRCTIDKIQITQEMIEDIISSMTIEQRQSIQALDIPNSSISKSLQQKIFNSLPNLYFVRMKMDNVEPYKVIINLEDGRKVSIYNSESIGTRGYFVSANVGLLRLNKLKAKAKELGIRP